MVYKRVNNFFINVSPIWFFAVTATIFGIIFLLITPPFQTPDEPVHFYRAYQISQGNFIIDQVGSVAGGNLPASLDNIFGYTAYQPTLQFQPNVKYDIHKTHVALSIKEAPKVKKLYDMSATAYYSPVSYLPQSVGILIARLMHMPPIVMMYLARVMNLTAWIILIAISIKLMPYKKWALVAVGLIPMAIFDAISLGADVMTYGLIAITLASVLKITYDKKQLETKNILMLIGLLGALVLSKEIAFIFVPLIFLIPSRFFGSKKVAVIKTVALVVLPMSLLAIWFMLLAHLKLPNSNDFHANPHEQLKYIIENPLSYANVLWTTYFFTGSDGIMRSFIGTFGWMDTPLSELIASIGYVGLAFLIIANYGERIKSMTKKQTSIILSVGLIFWLATTTALYVYYDPVKFKSVIGLQGRYFLPIAILAIPLFASFGDRVKVSKLFYKQLAIIFSIFMLTSSAITIFYRYYITIQ